MGHSCLKALLACLAGIFWQSPADASSADACKAIHLTITEEPAGSLDRFVSPSIPRRYGAYRITFKTRSDPLRGRRVVGIDAMDSTLFLDDGSAVLINRKANPDGGPMTAVLWSSLKCFDDGWRSMPQDPTKGDIVIGGYGTDHPESLRLERSRGSTKLLRVSRRIDDAGRVAEKITPLIVTERPVEAFGLSPRPIDSAGGIVLRTVAREPGNSIVIASYQLP